MELENRSIKRGPFGSAIKKSMFVPSGKDTYKVYEQGNAIRATYDYGNYYLSGSDFERLESFEVLPRDIIISCAGTIGRSYLIPEDAPKGVINQALLRLTINEDVVDINFFLLAFQNQVEKLNDDAAGTAMKNLGSVKYLKSDLIWLLPPVSEQKRIMQKYYELKSMIDSIEQEQNSIQILADQLKKTVLDVAMQGKLVPQDPNDEPASVLLEKIRAEKKKLYEEGKIKKKDLVETEIVKCEDNAYYEKIGKNFNKIDVPYQIPNTWKWSRLRDIVSLNIGGGTPSKNNRLYWDGDIPWASVKDIQSNTLSKTFELITDIGLSNSSANIVPKGNVVIATRMSLNKVAVTIIDTAINQDLRGLFFVTDELRDYFVRMYPHLKFPSLGTTVKGISLPVFNSTLVPLPNEQQLTKINLLVQEVDKYCLEFQ